MQVFARKPWQKEFAVPSAARSEAKIPEFVARSLKLQIISARAAPVAVSWSTLQGNPSLVDLADLNERKQWPDKKGRCKAWKPQAGISPYFLWSSR
ncbi:MAG: hypothetical protein DMG97_00490 [Acidobacteria bacterium]|nr:MAG: hypothetical protein DMG97_00490 [Acidobacteriota bacterium]